MWLRSWWTHSAAMVPTLIRPTFAWTPLRSRSLGESPRTSFTDSPRSGRNSSSRAEDGLAQSPRAAATDGLVPTLERGVVLDEERPDPAGEPAPLGLHDVTQHLVGAPLAGLRVPPAAGVAEAAELRDDHLRRGGEQVRDPGRVERGRWHVVGHADPPVAGASAVTVAGASATAAAAAAPAGGTPGAAVAGMTGRDRPPSTSQQAADWPSPTSNSGGSSTLAPVERQRTARVEPAAGRDVGGVGRLADEDRPVRARAERRRFGRRGDRDERLRVRVVRPVDDRVGRADLHDLAQVHDRDPVGDDPRQRQVVGDEQVGEAALLAQVEHEPQELRPDRDVEHRDRLVRDDEIRAQDDAAGDDDPLALAAGQLVREAERVLARPAAGRPLRAPRGRAPRARRTSRPMWLTTSGSATKSWIVCLGFRVSYGSWKMIWTRRRYVAQRRDAPQVGHILAVEHGPGRRSGG